MYITFFNNYFHFCCYFVFLEVSFIPAFFSTNWPLWIVLLCRYCLLCDMSQLSSLQVFLTFIVVFFQWGVETMKYLQSVLEIWEVLTANKFTFANGHLNIVHLIWMIGLETIIDIQMIVFAQHHLIVFAFSAARLLKRFPSSFLDSNNSHMLFLSG